MKKNASFRLCLLVIGLALSFNASADWGIFQSYIITDSGLGNEYRAGSINGDGAVSFIGHNYGVFPAGGNFILNGAELKTFKNNNNGNSDVCGGSIFYRVYNLNDTPGSFASIGIGFSANLGGGDQRWANTTAGVNLLNGLPQGDYALEIFWEATGSQNGGCGEFRYDSNPGDDWRGFFSVGTPPSVTFNFEGAGETKGAYASGTVSLSGFNWDMTEFLIGTDAADYKGGARSARSRGYGTSSMTMLVDKNNGIGNVRFYYRRYGTDAQVAHVVEYSTDGGTSWTQLGSSFTASTAGNADFFNASLNQAGSVRLRIRQQSGAGAANFRLNIDDIQVTDFCVASACADLLDSFDDGDFTTGTVWSGDTDKFTVVQSSDASTGAPCSNTLRLNETVNVADVAYISTPFTDWQLNQDWSFWIGRRAQAFTAANTSAVWLYANNADLTAPTISGYRIFAGDNTGGDEIFLQRVDNGVATNILASAEITNGRTDFGLSIRVTRTASGDWELFTSTLPAANGQGSIATDCPASVATISAGTATDNTYVPYGTAYTGVVALYSSSAAARAGFEFDQFSIATNSSVVLGCTNATACNYDPAATSDDGSCDFSCYGCTDATAANYDAGATIDDGSCVYEGCTDPSATNFNALATLENGSCTYGAATLVITELHYNPCADQGTDANFEFLELYNASGAAITLDGWEILGFEFTFPAASSIAAGEYIIIVPQNAGPSYSGNGYQVFELTNPAGLNNSGEAIAVLDDLGNYIDYVLYGVSGDWPSEPNGNCTSLSLDDITANNNAFGNWSASSVFGGTPGAPNVGSVGCADCGMGATVDTFVSDDFESGTLAGWTESALGTWEASTASPINGTFSMKHIGGAGTSAVSYTMGNLIADDACTVWRFTVSNTDWSPSIDNNFAVFLMANASDLTSANVDGYALGVDLSANANGNIALWQVVDGSVSNVIITYPYAWDQNETVVFEISHTEAGEWVLKADVAGGSGLLLAGSAPVSAVAGASGEYFGVRFNSDAGAAGKLRIDDIEVTQCGVEETYYSVATGNISDAIWNTDTNAMIGEAVTFTQYKNMVVRNGQTVTADLDVVVNNLTIDAVNTTGVLLGGGQTFGLKGNWTNDGGIFTAGTSSVFFNGLTPQTVNGPSTTTFENVTLENASGLTLNANLVAHGVILPNLGDFDANGNNVVLLSDATGTGSIGEISPFASYTGNTVAERFIPSGVQSWVNLCSPIPGSTLSDWNNTLITTGFAGSDFPSYFLNNILQYDETVAGGLNDGFVGATNITNTFDAERGYFVFMQGSTQFVSVTGNIQQGSLSTTLNYTSTGIPANDGWELIANRYPSEIDFEELYAMSTNIAPTYYVYDAENAVYAYYTAGFGGTASGYIPSGQSFWVQTIGSGAAVQFEEYMKSATGASFERNYMAVPRVTLSLTNGTQTHYTSLAFESGSELGFEAGKDAFVLGGPSETAPQISLVAAGGERTTLNRIDTPQGYASVPVHVRANAAGTFTLGVDAMAYLPEGLCISIEDLTTGEITAIEAGDTFTWTQNEAFIGDRFELHFAAPFTAEAQPVVCSADGSIEVEVFTTGTLQLEDLDANVIESIAATAGTYTFDALTSSDYRVRFISDALACGNTSMDFWIDEPAVVSNPSVSPQIALCDEGATGSIFIAGYVNNFSAQLFFNGALFAEGDAVNQITFEGLNAGVYEVIASDNCGSTTFTVDLTDENALNAQLFAEDVYTLAQGVAVIAAEVTTAVSAEVVWYLNNVMIATGNVLNYLVYATGEYVLEAVVNGTSCSIVYARTITVDQASSVNASEAVNMMLGHGNELWNLQGTAVTGQLQIDVFSADGKLIRRDLVTAESQVIIQNGDLSTGIYTVRVSQANGTHLATFKGIK
jgi:hypothetical protein